MKKWFSALLALVMMLSLLPMSVLAANDDVTLPKVELEHTSRNIPGVIPEKTPYTYPSMDQVREVYPDMGLYSAAAQYDNRQNQSSVKNQASNGLCWTFATYAAMEAYMLKRGMGEFDFAELHMGYSTAAYEYNGKLVNEKYGYKFSDGARTPGSGGNRDIASAYLMRGELSGAVMEEDDPYVGGALGTAVPYRDPKINEGKAKSYDVKDIMFLCGYDKANADEFEIIKDAVVKYGAVATSTVWSDSAVNEEHAAYYMNPIVYKYFQEGGHAITIVGWDDNYPKENFGNEKLVAAYPDGYGGYSWQPENDGAWIVKNSWGESWGDEGYFYVSYEDYCFPYACYVFNGKPAKWNAANSKIYESDVYATWFWGTEYEEGNTAEFIKAYPIEAAGQTVRSVRVYLQAGGTVAVDVIPEFEGLDDYTFRANTIRKVAFPGWYTIDLKTPVELPESGKFAVAVQLSDGADIRFDADNALGDTEAYSKDPGASEYADCNGTEYVKGYGDIYLNFAIKAVCTTSADEVPAAAGKPIAKAGKGEVMVEWKAVEGATDYAVFRRTYDAKTNSYDKWVNVAKNLTKPTFTDSKVEGGATYQYRVRTHNAAGYGAYSSASAKVTPSAACKMPAENPYGTRWAAPTAVYDEEKGGVVVSWTDIGALSYCVLRVECDANGDNRAIVGCQPNFNKPSERNYEPGLTSIVDTTAKGGTYCCYCFVAAFTDGTIQSYYSDHEIYGSGKPVAIPVPEVPATPAKPTAKIMDGVIRLSWTPVEGADTYNIYRRSSEDGKTWSKWQLYYEGAEETVGGDYEFVEGVTYQYRLRAVNAGGMSASSPVSNKIVAPNPVPPTPAKPTAELQDGAILVSWTKVSGANGYFISRSVDGGEFKRLKAVSETSFVDDEVKIGHTYQYVIQSFNPYTFKTSAMSDASDELYIPMPEKPAVPEKPIAKATVGKITLKWREVAGADSYQVYRREKTADGWSKWTKLAEIDGFQIIDDTVKAGTTYQYRLRAVNVAGISNSSAASSAVKAK